MEFVWGAQEPMGSDVLEQSNLLGGPTHSALKTEAMSCRNAPEANLTRSFS
jgi:hypothetical protein